MAGRLRTLATDRGAAVSVVGPAPAYIARRADRWRWNVVLRGDDPVGAARRRRRRAVVGRRRPGIAALSRRFGTCPVRRFVRRLMPPTPGGRRHDRTHDPHPDEPNADRPASDETFTWTTDRHPAAAARPTPMGPIPRAARTRRAARQAHPPRPRSSSRSARRSTTWPSGRPRPSASSPPVPPSSPPSRPTARHRSPAGPARRPRTPAPSSPPGRAAGPRTSVRRSTRRRPATKPEPRARPPRTTHRPRRRRLRLPTAAPRRRTDPARPDPRYIYSAP